MQKNSKRPTYNIGSLFLKHNIPNVLTFSRIVIIPVFILTFLLPKPISNWAGLIIFLGASLTDFFDGYLARSYKLQSSIGKIFDPIADKLLITMAITMLIYISEADLIILLSGLIILFREILISGIREYLATSNQTIDVTKLAKYKTTFQLIAFSILILGSDGSGIQYVDIIGKIMLIIAVALTLITCYNYIQKFIQILNNQKLK